MIIQKDEKTYLVSEARDHWTISRTEGKLRVSYKISREVCPDAEALRQYVESEAAF